MSTSSQKAPPSLKIDRAITQAAHDAAPLFAANRWRWHSPGPGIPQEPHIAVQLRRLAESLLREGCAYDRTSTGRLIVNRYEDDLGKPQLAFSLDLGNTETA